MTVSIVLRVAVAPLAEGRLAGQVEMVEDGTRLVIRDADELVAFVRCHLGMEPGSKATGRWDDTSPGIVARDEVKGGRSTDRGTG
jgi:hypothetical protein